MIEVYWTVELDEGKHFTIEFKDGKLVVVWKDKDAKKAISS